MSWSGAKVSINARVLIEGSACELEPGMAGETLVPLVDGEPWAAFDGDALGLIARCRG